MPLFDLNNLEHTSCQGGGCGRPYGPTMIIYSQEEGISQQMIDAIRNPPASQPPVIITSKLKRGDFL